MLRMAQSPRDEVQPLEVFLAGMTFIRCVLVLPIDMFSFAPSLYRWIGLAPQVGCGLASLVFGMFAYWASMCGTRRERLLAMWGVALHWFALAGLFFASNPLALTYWVSCLWIATRAVWVISRLAGR